MAELAYLFDTLTDDLGGSTHLQDRIYEDLIRKFPYYSEKALYARSTLEMRDHSWFV